MSESISGKTGSSDGRDAIRRTSQALLLGAVPFAAGVAAFAYLGSFMRYSSDDYCQAATLRGLGLWQTQLHTYREIVGRFSFTFASSIADLLGPRASGWIPFLTLLVWLLVAFWVLGRLAKEARLSATPGAVLYPAAAMVFLTIYQAPDRAQSLFWRSGVLAYSAPLVFFWLLLSAILWAIQESRLRRVAYGVIFLLAVAGAGFSETGASFQFAALVVIGAAALVAFRPRPWRRHPLPRAFLVAIAGTGIALAVMAATPSTLLRLASLQSHPDVLSLAVSSVRSGVSFLRETAQGLPLPSAISLGLGFALGLLWGLSGRSPLRIRPALALAGTAGVLAGVVLIVGAVYAPTLYSFNAVPGARSLLPARHIVVVGLLAVGVLWGLWVAGVIERKAARFVIAVGRTSALLLLVISIYPIRGAAKVLESGPLFARWATFWDARHQAILEAASLGGGDLHVIELDNIIPELGELRRVPTHYYNQCAAGYYGVKSITADLPGWDG